MNEPKEPADMQQALRQPDSIQADASADILFGGGSQVKNSVAPITNAGPTRQNFSGHRVFRILARTKILTQPNYQTDVIGMLSPGERVSAEAMVENWLQIRSTSGRVGFIFAQDAEPEAG